MIYFCADDYGLCYDISENIKRCIDEGGLNKVSIFPNFEDIDLANKNIRLSLHLNLVEGRCMADAEHISLLADKEGNFRHTFLGLLKLNLFHAKKLEAEAYKEIHAQVSYWKSILPQGAEFCIDSHQHTHMIPAVFKALMRVLADEKTDLKYMRIPAEPILPYLKTPSLYFTYSAVNVIKQWLLKFLWLLNKRYKKNINSAYFMGILFSGKMDEKRVGKILPKYIKMAERDGKDIEVLFHPGYSSEDNLKNKNIVFKKFYLSENRKTEYDCLMKISEGSVYNALY